MVSDGMKRDGLILGLIVAYCLVIVGFTLRPQILFGETTDEAITEQAATMVASVDTNVQFEVLPDSPDPNEVFKLVNQERVVEGQKPLIANAKLGEVAMARAKDMAARQYYAHKSPDGKYYYDLFPDYDVKTDYSCENLDIVFVPSAEEFIKEWVGSTAHHACLVNPVTTEAGFAVTKMMLLEYGGQEVPAYLVVGIHATSLK